MVSNSPHPSSVTSYGGSVNTLQHSVMAIRRSLIPSEFSGRTSNRIGKTRVEMNLYFAYHVRKIFIFNSTEIDCPPMCLSFFGFSTKIRCYRTVRDRFGDNDIFHTCVCHCACIGSKCAHGQQIESMYESRGHDYFFLVTIRRQLYAAHTLQFLYSIIN